MGERRGEERPATVIRDRVRPEAAEDSARVISDKWTLVQELGLITGATLLVRAEDPNLFSGMFPWVSECAVRRTHRETDVLSARDRIDETGLVPSWAATAPLTRLLYKY